MFECAIKFKNFSNFLRTKSSFCFAMAKIHNLPVSTCVGVGVCVTLIIASDIIVLM